MEVYLIRHTTPAISPGLIYGRTDVALAETFVQEKKLILAQLPPNLDAVYSSPSTRCTRLAGTIGDNFIVDKDLYELDFGEWEGKTWDTIDRAASDFWMEDFVNRCPPAGETMRQMQTRVLAFWDRLIKLDYKSAAIFTHAVVIRILSAFLNNLPLQKAFDLKVAYGQVFKVEI